MKSFLPILALVASAAAMNTMSELERLAHMDEEQRRLLGKY